MMLIFERIRLPLVISIAAALKATFAEYCPRYNNTDGELTRGFYCPKKLHLFSANDNYCCGNTSYYYCCHDITKSTYKHTSTQMEEYWIEYWPYFGFIGALILFAICTPFLQQEKT